MGGDCGFYPARQHSAWKAGQTQSCDIASCGDCRSSCDHTRRCMHVVDAVWAQLTGRLSVGDVVVVGNAYKHVLHSTQDDYIAFIGQVEQLCIQKNASLVLTGSPPLFRSGEMSGIDCSTCLAPGGSGVHQQSRVAHCTASCTVSKQVARDTMRTTDHAPSVNGSVVEASLARFALEFSLRAQPLQPSRRTWFFPVMDYFCEAHICSLLIPGTLTLGIVDESHLTPAGALYVAPFLACAFERWGLL